MEESTPKKFHPPNLICRLCCEAFESRHLTRVFGRASKKEGSKGDLSSKIRSLWNWHNWKCFPLDAYMQEVPWICVQGEWLQTKVYANANTAGTTVFSEALCRALPVVQAAFKALNQRAPSFRGKLLRATQLRRGSSSSHTTRTHERG